MSVKKFSLIDGAIGYSLDGEILTNKVIIWANERNIDLNDMSDMDKLVLKIEMKMWTK